MLYIVTEKSPFGFIIVYIYRRNDESLQMAITYRTPFVEGTSSVRSSILVALSRAFATPLKIASAM